MYKRDIYLDIDDNLNNYIKSVELDSNSRVWHFHLTVDYEPLDLTGKSVQFRAEKPDKTNVLNDCKIVDAEKGVVEVKLTRQVNAIPGHVKCLLKIIGDEGFVLKTKTFVVDVSKTLSDDAVVSSDEFGALEAALGKVQDIDNRFAQTNAQLSDIDNRFEQTNAQLSKAKRYYENVETMKTDTSLETGMLVETKGYYESGDAGSGIYEVINYDESLLVDNGLIHELQNGLYAKLIIKDTINLKQIGLNNDDNHHLITRLSNIIKLNNICIDGLGFEITTTGGFDISNVNNVELKNIILNGCDKLQFRLSNHIKIHNCEFKNTKHDCLVFQYCDDIEIYNNKFDNIGLELTQYNIDGRGIYFYNYQNSDNKMNDNQFIHDNIFNNINGKGAVVIHNNCKKFKISNNYITNTVWSGVELFSITSANESFIENNYLYNIGLKERVCTDIHAETSGVGASAIYGNGDCNNITVKHNKVINCLENGIEGSYSYVTNNIVLNTGIGSDIRKTESIEGIYINQFTINTVIENNEVYSKRRAIAIAPGNDYNSITIRNNKLGCETGDDIYFNGIKLNEFIIKNNVLKTINGIINKKLNNFIVDNECSFSCNIVEFDSGYFNIGSHQQSEDVNLHNTNSEWTLSNGTVSNNAFTTSTQYGSLIQKINLTNIIGHTKQVALFKIGYKSSQNENASVAWLRFNNNTSGSNQYTLKGTNGANKTTNILFIDKATDFKNKSELAFYNILNESISVNHFDVKIF